MSPEEYAALLATGKVNLSRDLEDNYIFNAKKTTTGVLPRDIIEKLQLDRAEEVATHTARLAAFDKFILDLQNTN